MNSPTPISIGIVGMGFMGQTHLKSFQSIHASTGAARVVAVADRDPARRSGASTASGNLVTTGTGAADPFDGVRGYATPQELLADPEVQAVSVCTPTDSHAEVAIAALKAGKHVLIEKPVALDLESVRAIEQAAKSAGRVCMPAMCMRFWPGWTWLKEAVSSRRYGNVLSASFTRIGSRPSWAPEFYLDPTRSGGAMFDLHVHDVDVIYWLFGMPESVCATGDAFGVSAVYRYGAGGPGRVAATGAWLTPQGFPFRMQFLVEFEAAIADWDLTRTPTLRVVEGGKVQDVDVGAGAGYEPEAVEFVAAVQEARQPRTTLDDAAAVTRIILAERESQGTGRECSRGLRGDRA